MVLKTKTESAIKIVRKMAIPPIPTILFNENFCLTSPALSHAKTG